MSVLIKKIVLIFIIFLSSPAFALDRKELNVEFFNRFNDDCLYRYINQALENNHTAKQATHRVEQYRQQVKYSFGKELPSLNVSAKYLGIKVPLLDNFMLDQNAFVLPFSVNYEPDFLLKNRDKTKSEKKAYEASKYDEKAIYITLLTDVATVYTNLLQYDSLIKIAQERIDANSKLLVADERKYERGILTTSDLNETLDDLEEAKNDIENYKKQQQTLLLQLGTLIGCMDIENFSRGTLDEIEYQKTIPDEISSDVIFSRPDVKMAEANLQKAKIDVRIARKEFLPSFNITGLWAFNTIAPGTFFSWQSSLAALLAGATQDIFMGGQKIATLKKQKAKRKLMKLRNTMKKLSISLS